MGVRVVPIEEQLGLTQQELLNRFPLKVAHPRGGDFFLLLWWTQHTRGHALLAKSEARIEQMLARVYEREGPEVQVRDYRRISLVRPPVALSLAFARAELEKDIESFRMYVGGIVSLAGPEAAAKIFGRRCSQYLHAWYVSEEEKATKESEDSKHWYCRNCFHGRLPVGQTVESLYELRHAGPRVFPGEYQHSPPQRKPQFFLSEAKEHDPAQPLWHIEQRFGDHSDGLAVMELDSPLEEEGKRFSINQSWGITFFFQGEVLKVPPHFKTLANGARSRVKEKERTRAQKHKHEQVSRAVQAQNILLGLLPEPPEDT